MVAIWSRSKGDMEESIETCISDQSPLEGSMILAKVITDALENKLKVRKLLDRGKTRTLFIFLCTCMHVCDV